ncbi:MAG: hypothetical protein RLZZ175_2384 [Bacteroidota bacterium]|jgi:hypothetical protein
MVKFIKSFLLLSATILSSLNLKAQNGYTQSFSFVQKPISARVLATGGAQIAYGNNDAAMFLYNPALLDTGMNKSLSLGYQYYIADIRNNTVAYAHTFKKIGTLGFGIQNTNYGEMDLTDPTGKVLGSFSANENSLIAGYSLQQGAFKLGLNAKYASSNINNLRSNALLFDGGMFFQHPKKELTLAFTINNIGGVLATDLQREYLKIPLNVQAGLSYRLEHMPLRFYVTAHTLHRYDIRYDDPNKPVKYDLSGQPIEESNNTFDKIMRHTDIVFRHLVFGGEFMLGKGFHLRFGYNHQMRREMQIENAAFSFAGFSFGTMIRIAKMEFSYTRTNMHLAAGANTIGLGINFGAWKKKV